MNDRYAETEAPGLYEIRVKGQLHSRWAGRFEGLALVHDGDGATVLRGPLADQAALHGVLSRIRDLGLPILSLQRVRAAEAAAGMMQAIVQPAYGAPGVLGLREVERPALRDDGVLVRVRASSVNRGDWFALTGRPYLLRLMGYGLRKPRHRIPGMDVAGRVEAAGPGVTQFRPGDEVFGDLSECGLGAYAEYVCVPANALAPKPRNATFEQAAAAPVAATTALQGLRDAGRVRPGDRVLINGAAGGVGTFAVQIAKAFGAEVTGVCSARGAEMVRAIGAAHVIDYAREDFTQGGARYDVIFDLVGNRSLAECRRALAARGTLVLCAGMGDRPLGPLGRILQALALGPFIGQSMRPLAARPTQADLLAVKDLMEAGKVVPVIDRRYALAEVPEALRAHGTGHARGKSVIIVSGMA